VIGWPRLDAPKKIGILGGTFDPPHMGHLKLATHFSKQLQLDELLLIPSGQPWQKDSAITSAEIRLQLTEAAAIELARAFLYLNIPTKIGIDRIEIDRAGPSYAIDTIKSLRERFGKKASLIWLMGLDSLINLSTWNSWQELLDYMNLAIASRPHYDLQEQLPVEINKLLREHQSLETQALATTSHGYIYLDQSLSVDLSSTELRNRLKTLSRSTVTPEQIPSRTLEIITSLGLYQ